MKGLFFETSGFTANLARYLGNEEYRQVQLTLLLDPESGALMPGAGGFRKLRWSDSRRGKGKRGGLRLIYYWLEWDSQFWMFAIYDKDEVKDLTQAQKRQLKRAITAELETRGVK